jgi:putative DNA primase/helicase
VGRENGEACFKAMGVPVVAVSDTDDLGPVAKSLHDQYPRAKWIVAGDLSAPEKAEKAARAIDAEIAFPIFPPGHFRSDDETSFHHLDLIAGPGAVRDCIERAEGTEERKEREDALYAHIIEKVEAAVERLAAFGPVAYEVARLTEAKALKIPVRSLDRLVHTARLSAKAAAAQPAAVKSKPSCISVLEPWLEAVDGQKLLEDLVRTIQKYVVLSDAEAVAAALWVLFSHTHDCWRISPILAVESPDLRCGKTALLTVLEALVPDALMCSNATGSAVFRTVDEYGPTLVIDEGDTFLKTGEALRGILNSGHNRKGAYVIRGERTKGGKIEPRAFSTWCPKIFGLIGKLPRTLQDRSIVIALRRKLPSEEVASLNNIQEVKNLGRMAARWALDNADDLGEQEPALPEELHDREKDNWRALIAVADWISGDWPVKARDAAIILSTFDLGDDDSDGVKLLTGVHDIFEKTKATELRSKPIIKQLHDDGWIFEKTLTVLIRPNAQLIRGGQKTTPIDSSEGHTSRADVSRNAVNALKVADRGSWGIAPRQSCPT